MSLLFKEEFAVSIAAPRTRRLPLALKVLYSAFMAVMVPVYWYNWGPTNFLYFCDTALFLTLVSLWTEIPLFASMAACGILLPQALWVADFVSGSRVTGMTAYMFDPKNSVFARGLSSFHGWLPFLLVYLVWRLGYDRRSLVAWTLLAWVLLVVSYLWLPAPPPGPATADTPPELSARQEVPEKPRVDSWKWCGNDPPSNVNYVYGPSDDHPQEWMAPNLYFMLIVIGFPLCLYVPAHLILRTLFRQPP
jgi:hypothetical protein